MATFAEIITELRGEKKRQEVADDVGISRASLEYYEKGKRKPDIEILAKFADYFGVSADYLLGRTDVKTVDKDLQFVCEYTNLSEVSVNLLHSSWAPSVSDIIDFLLGATSYHDFWGFCHELRKYRMQYRELLEDRESIMNDKSRKPCSSDELIKAIEHYDSLQDSKDLYEFKLQKLFTNMLNSYCESEVEADNKSKPEFQKTYDYLIGDFMSEFLSSEDGDTNGNNPQT